jgi:Flp pilus assembly protein TadB
VVDVTLLVVLLTGGALAGLWLLIPTSRVADEKTTRRPRLGARRGALLQRRLISALAAGFAAAVVTRWPVPTLAIGALGWFAPELFGSRAARDRETARTEAIAAWTEMLRDTITGAHGLEEAIMTSASVAPDPIRREVVDLAVRLERQPLTSSLEAFADELAHPTADLVVAALRLASEGAVGDLAELLGTLAVSARDEAGMRLRVEAARARLRTAVRVITGCTLATALGLLLLNRPYLAFYGTTPGQAILAVVAGLWAASLMWLGRMADFVTPERFLATRTTEPPA